MVMFYALIALCLSGSALAQVPSLGSCPRLESQSNFEVSKFTGDWYEYARYFTLVEIGGGCNEINFSSIDNSTIRVINSFFVDFTGKIESPRADLRVDPKNPSKMLGTVPLTPLDVVSDCWVLGTDYDSYSVAYCCAQYNYFNLKWSWIMTKERLPPKSVVRKAYKVIDSNKVERKHFLKTEQKRCPVKLYA